jgi:Tol biopolymer transport system component
MSLLLSTGVALAGNSDDGSRIAFVGNQGGSFQLYTMDPDATHIVQITNLAPTDFESWMPDFSPDGGRLTFCYGPSNAGPIEIYAMKVDGTDLVQLTNDGLFDCAPHWSPDGTHILFFRAKPDGSGGLSTMRADGSHIRDLTESCFSAFGSAYTSDGSRIIFDSEQGGLVSAIWIMNADGTHQIRLTAPPLRAAGPTHPFHDRVVFVNNINNAFVVPNSLFSMNLDGSDVVELTFPVGSTHDVSPASSPDGSRVVFASDRLSSDASLDLFTMKADGSDMQRILTGITVGGCPDGNCVTPAWGRKP